MCLHIPFHSRVLSGAEKAFWGFDGRVWLLAVLALWTIHLAAAFLAATALLVLRNPEH